MDISHVLSPEPLLWADDDAEREQNEAQRRRYLQLLYFCACFDFILL